MCDQPTIVQPMRRNLERWIAESGDTPLRAHLEWRVPLAGMSLPAPLDLLRSDTEEDRRLRQSSALTGPLTAEER